jgi:hypothetical protein
MGYGADAVTITPKDFGDAGAGTGISQRVEVRHSKACNAVWSRVRAGVRQRQGGVQPRVPLRIQDRHQPVSLLGGYRVLEHVGHAVTARVGTLRWIVFGNPQIGTNSTGPS